MSDVPHILVVDDDKRIRTMLQNYLVEAGLRVSLAENGAGLRAAFAQGGIDLILLDLVMPGDDGLSLAREVRQRSAVPIIILTGMGDPIDRVAGLEAGADDYIAKPFHLREVLARVRSVLRRAPCAPAEPVEAKSERGHVLAFAGWRLDLMKRELRRASGEPVELTGGEFELLRAFVSSPNRVLDRDQLMDRVKGRDWAAFDRAIDTQVVRLRRKIERDPAHPELIKTVRGAGYIFATEVTEA